jgi:hypothetical protein
MPGPDDRELLLVGKKMGNADIVVFDREGGLITHMEVAVGVERGKTRFYSRPGNIHAYFAYSCNAAGCMKIADENEGFERIAPPNTPIIINQPGSNPVFDRPAPR